jgi:AcrR family transcriptional regulator
MSALTLRETNKADKQKRIQEAARHLFGTQDFDTTSTRDIASLAGVGLATLFLYAEDKRDLLFLAGNDDLDSLTGVAFKHVSYTSPLLDQLSDVFRHFFKFYGKNRTFSRNLLRELTFYTTGRHSERFLATRQATIGSIEQLVREARRRGTVKCTSSDARIAEVIFYVFAADVRRWLGQEDGTVASGIAHLRSLLEVVLSGVA